MLSGKKIFVAPLDWGLGHATRCVPLIRQLQSQNQVILGVTGLSKNIFDEEFPELEKIFLPAYNISYSVFFPLWMKLSADWPRIAGVIKAEKKALKQIVDEHKIDTVISDNRFGLHSSNTYNIFMTHQVFLKSPFAEGLVRKLNKSYIMNFDEIWVPDFEEENKSLSGELSHGNHFHKKVRYIGPLSRLEKMEAGKKYEHLFLLSGPEPQRSLLANSLLAKVSSHPNSKFVLVSEGGSFVIPKNQDNLHSFISPGKKTLCELISQSENIVCRSGYSTLMDLHHLGKTKALLVPTPGQTEQEYLADHWEKSFGFRQISQKALEKFSFG